MEISIFQHKKNTKKKRYPSRIASYKQQLSGRNTSSPIDTCTVEFIIYDLSLIIHHLSCVSIHFLRLCHIICDIICDIREKYEKYD